MMSGLCRLYLFLLVGLVVQPAWGFVDAKPADQSKRETWESSRVRPASETCDYSQESESARRHKEIKGKLQKQGVTALLLLRLADLFSIKPPAPVFFGAVAEFAPHRAAGHPGECRSIRGPPAMA